MIKESLDLEVIHGYQTVNPYHSPKANICEGINE